MIEATHGPMIKIPYDFTIMMTVMLIHVDNFGDDIVVDDDGGHDGHNAHYIYDGLGVHGDDVDDEC